jgi:hypothetical protein
MLQDVFGKNVQFWQEQQGYNLTLGKAWYLTFWAYMGPRPNKLFLCFGR